MSIDETGKKIKKSRPIGRLGLVDQGVQASALGKPETMQVAILID